MAENGIITIARSSFDGRMRGRWPDGDFPGDFVDGINEYTAGHSIRTHLNSDPPNWPADDYTELGTWWALFAAHAGWLWRGGGNFGQINSLNTDWESNWLDSPGPPRSSEIQYSYTSDELQPFYPSGSFASQGFTHFCYMASNFEQESDAPASWIARTQTILDRHEAQSPGAQHSFYMTWPNTTLAGSFVDHTALTTMERQIWWDYGRGDYMDWHLDWINGVRATRQSLKIKIIPVCQVIFDLWENEAYMSSVAFSDLIGDVSGHGKHGMYCLAALVMMIATHRRVPDLTGFSFPVGATQVPAGLVSNITSAASYIESRLAHYEDLGYGVY